MDILSVVIDTGEDLRNEETAHEECLRLLLEVGVNVEHYATYVVTVETDDPEDAIAQLEALTLPEDSAMGANECEQSFRDMCEEIGYELGKDEVADREAYNNYTDGLCKDGLISGWLYNHMDNPF